MSDTENKAPVEDVQMDAPAAPEEQAPAAETSAEEVKPAEDESKADQDENKKEANGDGAEADKEAPVVDEEKDDNVAANDEDVEAEANEDNEKPVSSKKPKSSKNNGSAAPASSRRKSAGGSKAAVEGNHSFKSGDIVLTRLKGYPPWRKSDLERGRACLVTGRGTLIAFWLGLGHDLFVPDHSFDRESFVPYQAFFAQRPSC
jgi:hypothetical protein